MARAIVTGLEFYRYLDGHGDKRRAPKGAEVDLDDAELRRAIKEGWVTPVAGHEPVDMPSRFQPPRDWSHRPSLWFVVPAWQRVELGRICIGHLAKTCAELIRLGIDASAVVVADDENLETARKLGFATIERGNMLGARINDGYQAAAENGVEFVVPLGNDDLVDAGLIARSLPKGDTVSAFRRDAAVNETGTQISIVYMPYEGGSGVRIWPVRLFAPCGYRPAVEDMHRAIDTTTLSGAKREQPVRFVYHETDGLDLVDFKSDVQLNCYRDVAKEFGEKKMGDPFAVLAGRYPAATLKALQKFYGHEPAPAKRKEAAHAGR